MDKIKLESFKAGANWVSEQIKIGNDQRAKEVGSWGQINIAFETVADAIKLEASSLKEIPKS